MSDSFVVIYGMTSLDLTQEQKRVVCNGLLERLSHQQRPADTAEWIDAFGEALLRSEDGYGAAAYIRLRGLDVDYLHTLSDAELSRMTVPVHQTVDEQYNNSVESVAFATPQRAKKLISTLENLA